MKDELGERMKTQHEDRTRFSLPRRTYTIIRLDGKAFHTYTKGLEKPFDDALIEDMDNSIISMLPHIQGAVFAYTQSDEISVLVTDFALPTTSAWFDNNIQKMVSVSASIITAEFNRFRDLRAYKKIKIENSIGGIGSFLNPAYFDSRVFTIPDRIEVLNYFIWRNQDCARNSVSMVAQSLFSHKQLQGKSTKEMQEMMFNEHNINWADYDQSKKNGRLIVKEEYEISYPSNEVGWEPGKNGRDINYKESVKRNRWISTPAWKFTEDKDKLLNMIPKYE